MALTPRSLVPFESTGPNGTETIINTVPFNLTALQDFGYKLYSNSTLSNDSKCYLVFDAFKPSMLPNGTFLSGTSCYIPYYGIGTRGKASIAFGVCFGLTLVFTMINLNKHGRLHLREDKRFRVVGRRWQWYWMLFVAACGMISTLTGVDVDRYYLQQIPIVLQSFFFMMMVPGALAMVWEGTRHWASWQERQIVDHSPYGLPQDDKRSKFEFWAPLIFYLFTWIEFFMTIPRPWTPLEKQNTPDQIERIAKPAATNARGKAGAIIAVFSFAVILASLQHSIKHYKARPPWKLLCAITTLGVRVGYGIAAAWTWQLSIFKQDVHIGWPFGLGYGSILLILIIFEIAGFVDENEDKVLIQQRIARGRLADAELGVTKKPSWWDRHMASRYASDDERLRNMTREVGGGGRPGEARSDNDNDSDDVAVGRLDASAVTRSALEANNVRNRSTSRLATTNTNPFRDESPPPSYGEVAAGTAATGRGMDGVGQRGLNATPAAQSVRSERTDFTGQTAVGSTATTTAPQSQSQSQPQPQQRIRSMLDV